MNTTIKSRLNSFSSNIKLVALSSITGCLPSRQIDRNFIRIPQNIILADPEFHKASRVDILIGNALFYQLLSTGQIRLNKSVILQKTRFGWIVTGEAEVNSPRLKKCFVITIDDQI